VGARIPDGRCGAGGYTKVFQLNVLAFGADARISADHGPLAQECLHGARHELHVLHRPDEVKMVTIARDGNVTAEELDSV
jgi:hypothetical protein